jgi:hypothetical protein
VRHLARIVAPREAACRIERSAAQVAQIGALGRQIGRPWYIARSAGSQRTKRIASPEAQRTRPA